MHVHAQRFRSICLSCFDLTALHVRVLHRQPPALIENWHLKIHEIPRFCQIIGSKSTPTNEQCDAQRTNDAWISTQLEFKWQSPSNLSKRSSWRRPALHPKQAQKQPQRMTAQ